MKLWKLEKRIRNGSIDKDDVKIYIGNLIMDEPIALKHGHRVLTPKGIGTIHNMNMTLNDELEYIIELKHGLCHIRSKLTDLFQFYVHNEDEKRMIPLSFSDYDYVVETNQSIVYRITKRGYAKLMLEDRKRYAYARIFTKNRNGLRIYRKLKREGYEIRRTENICSRTCIYQETEGSTLE